MKADKLAELQKRITFLERELAKERGDRIHAEDERDSVADTMLRFSAKIRKLEKEIKDYKSQIIL
jgi:chromosome segregation ATPase